MIATLWLLPSQIMPRPSLLMVDDDDDDRDSGNGNNEGDERPVLDW